MPPSLKFILQTLDLGEKHIAVFSVLLESRAPMLVSAIARQAKLNRTTAYDILEELGNRGLVSRVNKDRVTRYQSIAIEHLPAYIERQRETLEETKRELADILPQIALIRSYGKILPKVQFFEGLEGVKQAYEDTLENNKGKQLYDFTGTDAIYRKMGEAWLVYYWKKRSRLDIECTVIAPDTEWSAIMKQDDEKYARITKLIPREFSFDSEIDIYDDKVGIFTFSQEHPIAVLIEDKTIHDTMKSFFNFALMHAK
ncbi:MAG TPA: helix-turn-helix domain-containing protein [Candidatus Paceibacterota bacterium]|nr:helix-turn-helix domain-containing protein [Candidatus Paceibacterota bacterium]